MKETVFYILISIKTEKGFESIGKFYVGDNRAAALAIFKSLKGDPRVDEKTILTLDLVETVNDLPVNMQIKACSLKQLGENCQIIVRDTFKLVNLIS